MAQDELSGKTDESDANNEQANDSSAAMDRRRFVERTVAAGPSR